MVQAPDTLTGALQSLIWLICYRNALLNRLNNTFLGGKCTCDETIKKQGNDYRNIESHSNLQQESMENKIKERIIGTLEVLVLFKLDDKKCFVI